MASTVDFVNESVESGIKDLLRAAELAAKFGSEDEKNPLIFNSLAEQLFKLKVRI